MASTPPCSNFSHTVAWETGRNLSGSTGMSAALTRTLLDQRGMEPVDNPSPLRLASQLSVRKVLQKVLAWSIVTSWQWEHNLTGFSSSLFTLSSINPLFWNYFLNKPTPNTSSTQNKYSWEPRLRDLLLSKFYISVIWLLLRFYCSFLNSQIFLHYTSNFWK